MSTDRRKQTRITVYRAEVPGSDEVMEVEYEAVADALHFACRDLRDGRRRPLEILENGVRIHDEESIARACQEEEDRMQERLSG